MRREEGESIKVIASRLVVSSDSVSRWVRDIELTTEQHAALAGRTNRYGARNKGQLRRSANARALRLAWQQAGRERARHGDLLHQAGCMLYWAEGSKSRNCLCFTNSDVAMMRLFVRFLRECYAVMPERLRCSVNCFLGNGLSQDAIERFWLDALELPRSSLGKTIVNRPSSASRRTGRILLHGTARVVLHSTEIAQNVYGAIQEYGGFEEPAWLR
jgi:hypothetical protein